MKSNKLLLNTMIINIFVLAELCTSVSLNGTLSPFFFTDETSNEINHDFHPIMRSRSVNERKRSKKKSEKKINTEIVGGSGAKKGIFESFVCSVVGTGGFGHYCACTVIAESVVMTAAHCFYSKFTVGDFVEIGKYYREFTDSRNDESIIKQYTIRRAIRPTDYDSDEFRHGFDVMLLRITGKIPYPPILLQFSKKKWKEQKTVFTVVGWGATKGDGSNLSSKLQESQVGFVKLKKCNRYWSKRKLVGGDLKRQLCAYSVGTDTCAGDSGGPLLLYSNKGDHNFVQVGIISFGTTPCAKYPGGVYTDLSSKAIQNFIHAGVCEKNSGLSPKSAYCENEKFMNVV